MIPSEPGGVTAGPRQGKKGVSRKSEEHWHQKVGSRELGVSLRPDRTSKLHLSGPFVQRQVFQVDLCLSTSFSA